MPLILPGNVATATAAVGYNIDNSCRFNDDDEAHMTFTLGAETSRDKFTISCWVKRSNFGIGPDGSMNIIHQYTDGSNHTFFKFVALDTLIFFNETGGSQPYKIDSSAVYRDPSAWYHIVIIYDSANATVGNRLRMFVNGAEVTALKTDNQVTTSGLDSFFYEDKVLQLGRDGRDTEYFDGYMAEFIFCDGQAYLPTKFGEFNDDSPTIWQPIDPSEQSITFGNNGWWLDFKNSAALGNDVSGNDNDWTPANLAAADQATDTPTNNFCTLNALSMYHTNTPTLEQGGCRFKGTASGEEGVSGTMGVSSGKWYFEMKKISQDSGPSDDSDRNVFGITAKPFRNQSTYADPESWMLLGNSVISNNNVEIASVGPSGLSDGGILQVALDLDNNRVSFGNDNAWQTGSSAFSGSYSDYESITAAASTLSGFYFPIIGDNSSSRGYTMDANFGGCPAFALSSAESDENGYGAFEFAPPSGFLAMCTKNLGSDGG